MAKNRKGRYLGERKRAPPGTLKPGGVPDNGFVPVDFFGISDLGKESLVNAGDDDLLIPGDSTFPVGDVVRRGMHRSFLVDLYQATVAHEHPISYLGLQQIAEAVRSAMGLHENASVGIRLFFCVPPERYRQFKKQEVKEGTAVVECPPQRCFGAVLSRSTNTQ
eukprot:gb/GECG01008693.1/.p1 GENE.gb/GECG01008693.1/~~gb/GECG01008693.1/.p1  ORF type:complete len:164 (+),score=19.11 gb/GECG01008693.1/:1-492(+)